MKTIWKYTIDADTPNPYRFQMPRGATVFRVGYQRGKIVFWAFIDTDAPTTERVFDIAGTGADLEPLFTQNAIYRGSVDAPPFVWHLFELLTPKGT